MTARWARGGEGRQGGGRSPLNPPQLRGRPGGSSPTTCWPRPHPCTPQSYLRNFWYAAALSSNVTDDKPLGVDILGGRITLFRDQETGEVRACTQPASSSRALHDLAPLPSNQACTLQHADSLPRLLALLTLQVKCIDDWCPHRGAPLSGGQVKVEPSTGHTCVVCPYQ